MSVSPDGRSVAFTGTTPDGATRLWVRRLDSLTATSIPETDAATLPFWSPDSDALGFFSAGQLWTIALAGGTPQFVANAPYGRGGSWNRDGTIVFAPDVIGPLVQRAGLGRDPLYLLPRWAPMSGVTCGRNLSPTGGTSSISPTAWHLSITISPWATCPRIG